MDKDTPRGGFRYATNRKVELILQKELDDVAKKSITQINAFKEARKNAPLSEEEAVTKYLLFRVTLFLFYFFFFCFCW